MLAETSVPCHMGLSRAAHTMGTWLPSEQTRKIRCPEWKPQSSCNTTSEVRFCHLCLILLARSKSLEALQSQGMAITQGHKHQKTKIIGHHLRGWQPPRMYAFVSDVFHSTLLLSVSVPCPFYYWVLLHCLYTTVCLILLFCVVSTF